MPGWKIMAGKREYPMSRGHDDRLVLRACPERLFPGEPPEHEADHGGADEGNGGAEVLLVMAYESAAPREP